MYMMRNFANFMSSFLLNKSRSTSNGKRITNSGVISSQQSHSKGLLLVLIACISATLGFMAGSMQSSIPILKDQPRYWMRFTENPLSVNSKSSPEFFLPQVLKKLDVTIPKPVSPKPSTSMNLQLKMKFSASSEVEQKNKPIVQALIAESDPLIRNKMMSQDVLRSLLSTMEVGKPVVVTIANSAFQSMLFNWLAHTSRVNMSNVMVGSLDEDMHKLCLRHGVTSLHLNFGTSKKDFRKDGKAFKDMGSLKTAFVLSILEKGWDVLISDTDVVWTADPWEVVRRNASMGYADVMVSTDSVSHKNDVVSMMADPYDRRMRDAQDWFRHASPRAKEIFGNVYEHAFNTGVLFFRSTPAAVEFCTAWHDIMRTKGRIRGWKHVWGDQHALNELSRIKMFPIKVVNLPEGSPWQRNNRIFWVFNRTVKLGVFPPAQFCNGHMYFVQRIPQMENIKVYVIHNTFQYNYGPGKIARFREAGLWMLDPTEYYSEGNFVSFDVEAPEWMKNMPAGWQRHELILEYYYEATRNALAIARILDRILIFPKFVCYCDRWWDLLTPPCRAPGVDVDPPFICPFDHLYNAGYWGFDGAKMQYRPHNFLEDSRVSSKIINSRSVVRLGKTNVIDESKPYLEANATDKETWTALHMYNSTRVLHFPNAIDAFCRYERNSDNIHFDETTFMFFNFQWCCAPSGLRANISAPPLAERSLDYCKRKLFSAS